MKMKTRSTLIALLFAATSFALLSNCSGNKTESATEDHDGHEAHEDEGTNSESAEAAPLFQVDAKFQEQLAGVFTSYIEMKDAFVASDQSKVSTEASQTHDALSKVDMKLLSGPAHNDWMNYLAPIEMSLKEIQASADIEVQRKSFSTLSDNLYKSIKAFGLGGKEAFYEYCPMAFDNEGAYWLSDQEQIRNPYFGDKMLTCGSVKEKLK